MDQFEDTGGKKYLMGFQKLVPGVRLTFKNRKALSTALSYVQWKTFFITEESLRVRRDTNIIGTE